MNHLFTAKIFLMDSCQTSVDEYLIYLQVYHTIFNDVTVNTCIYIELPRRVCSPLGAYYILNWTAIIYYIASNVFSHLVGSYCQNGIFRKGTRGENVSCYLKKMALYMY